MLVLPRSDFFFLFFFNDTATTEIYTLSLHDALPICHHLIGESEMAGASDHHHVAVALQMVVSRVNIREHVAAFRDRKSTRLNSSHVRISYAVFCLEKKKTVMKARQISVM